MLVQASSADVGTVTIQLAKHLGAQVATTVGPDILVLAEGLVADVVIDSSHEAVEQRLSGYGVALETLGGDVLHKSLGVLKAGGKLISIIRPIINQVSAFDESPAALARVASGRARGKVVIRVAPEIAQGGAKG